ncbi:IS110 family transposase [Faecalibacterium prausnitzii]|jgi:transposase|nr:IS110 family transposase [Faecalibacterium prausnitzii]MZJ18097.1 transposase [Enterococcus durans]
MFAVGIDISKSKSVAAILNQDGSMHTSPFEFHHTQPELDAFIKYILNSKQSATILMENTGHYHYPVLKAFQEAGLPVCMVNAYQIKKFGDMDLRKAKTDKKDAVRIARYALEKSYSLVPYTSMEQKYEDLRFLARQYNQRMLTLKTNKVFLLNLLDETMPGITNILPLTTRTPETSLSVLFINRFKSYGRIKKMGKSRFLDAFEKIARKSRNRQTKTYGLAIYEAALRNITTRGENEYTLAAQDQCLELVCESQKAAIQLF